MHNDIGASMAHVYNTSGQGRTHDFVEWNVEQTMDADKKHTFRLNPILGFFIQKIVLCAADTAGPTLFNYHELIDRIELCRESHIILNASAETLLTMDKILHNAVVPAEPIYTITFDNTAIPHMTIGDLHGTLTANRPIQLNVTVKCPCRVTVVFCGVIATHLSVP